MKGSDAVLLGEWWLTIIVYSICTTIFVAITFVHLPKYYQDIFTSARKSLDHRRALGRDLPKTTTTYQLAEFCTALNIITAMIHCFTLLANLLVPFFDDSENACLATIYASSVIALPKLFVYYVLTLRLDQLYHGSLYGIERKVLVYLLLFLTTYMIGITFSFNFAVAELSSDGKTPWKVVYNDIDGTEYYICDMQNVPFWFLFVWAFFDVWVTFFFVVLLSRPIRALLGKIEQNNKLNKPKKTKLSRKVIAYGKKTTILAATISVSTLFWTIIWGVFGINLFPIDDVINSICLLLMTPYYKNQKYNRWCKLCIWCCDSDGITVKDQTQLIGSLDENENESKINVSVDSASGKSIATASAIRVVAMHATEENINLLTNNNNLYNAASAGAAVNAVNPVSTVMAESAGVAGAEVQSSDVVNVVSASPTQTQTVKAGNATEMGKLSFED